MTSTPAGRQGFFLLSSKNISLKKGDEASRGIMESLDNWNLFQKTTPDNPLEYCIHAVPRRPKGGIGYNADEPRVTAAEDEHHLDLQKTGLHQPAGREVAICFLWNSICLRPIQIKKKVCQLHIQLDGEGPFFPLTVFLGSSICLMS